MKILPDMLQNLIQEMKKLPGVGGKSSTRLAFYLLESSLEQRERLAKALQALDKIHWCLRCFFVAEDELCEICKDMARDGSLLCIVEKPADVIAIEKAGRYVGRYHVLHGLLSPLEGVQPEDLKIPALLKRIEEEKPGEIIFALSPTLEGEMTLQYLTEQLKKSESKLTRLARGVPFGANLEFTDEMTMSKAFEGRQPL